MENRLLKYFNGVSDKIQTEFDISSTSINSGDKGFHREKALIEFLSKHLPMRLEPKLGGHIFGLNQNDSKQIDIMVVNDTGLNFLENSKPFYPTENLAAAFSIKSNLNGAEIEDCLWNIASIPKVDSKTLRFDDLHPTNLRRFIEYFPAFFIFSYDGIQGDTLFSHINEFYNKNASIPMNRRPAGILVNKKYYIKRNVSFTTNLAQETIAPNEFKLIKLVSEIKGYPFFHILNSINDYCKWLSNITINYAPYFDNEIQTFYNSLPEE